MHIDLRRMANTQGVRTPRIEAPKIELTKAQETDLARLYMRWRIWVTRANERIKLAYASALGEQAAMDGLTRDRAGDVEVEIEAVNNEAVRSVFTFRGLLQARAESMQVWHMRWFVSLVSRGQVDVGGMWDFRAGLRLAIGNTLPGAKGFGTSNRTRSMHRRRCCATGVYTSLECERHTKASAELAQRSGLENWRDDKPQ